MVITLLSSVIKNTWKEITSISKKFLGSKRKLFAFVALAITLTATNYIMTTGTYYKVTRAPNYVVINETTTRRSTTKPMSLIETKALVEIRLTEYYLQEKGMGCDIPKINPFSTEAMKFFKDSPKITCEGTDWVTCNKSECYVKEEIFKNMTKVSCSYKDIMYVDDRRYYLSDDTTVSGSEKYMLNKSDHVMISCTGTNLNRYSFGFLPVYSQWSGVKTGLRPVWTEPIPPDRKDSYNVMFLGFDSASHNGFIRKMPKSYKLLANRATILNGYNIVGDGTIAALFAILTGMAEHEHADARKKITKKVFVDHKLFLFSQLKKYGYQTAYFEDTPEGGTFQFKFNGFRRQPADHYLRPFFLEYEKIIFKGKRYNENDPWSYYCVGDTLTHQLLMNLTNELEGKKFCFTFIADICHDDFNLISTADDAVVWFLENLAARRVFEDTLVIVMGDHGIRIAQIRDTYQGKVEERLPLMAIFLPEKLKQLRPKAFEALSKNIDVLTTPFDIHATVLDVLDLKHKMNNYKVPGADLTRSMTLLEPIPKNRTCAEAGIVQHWCSCAKWSNVSEDSDMFNRVANVLAEYIDSASEEQRSKCARRKLVFIYHVLQLNVNKDVLTYRLVKDVDAFLGNAKLTPPRAPIEYYQAKIVMSPGRGIFEGTLTYYTESNYFWVTHKDISRVSRYGTEPECISATHPHLNPFCYCKHQRPKPRDIDLISY